MNALKSLQTASSQPASTESTPVMPPTSGSEAITPTASAARAPTAYRPRSWRYPMGLFQAVLPLDDGSAARADLPRADTGYGARYGNRQAWTSHFHGFGHKSPVEPECSSCNA